MDGDISQGSNSSPELFVVTGKRMRERTEWIMRTDGFYVLPSAFSVSRIREDNSQVMLPEVQHPTLASGAIRLQSLD